MSLLRDNKIFSKIFFKLSMGRFFIGKKQNPSPTKKTFFQKNRFAEGMSLPIFFGGEAAASMTVEAAVVLPLVLFFLLNLSCAVELIRLHGNLQMALWDTGSRLAVYGHALGDSDTAAFFTWFYIKDQITAQTGEEYLDNSPLKGGADGLMLWESDIFSSEDELDIIVTYSVSPWSSLAGFSPFRMANRYYAHIWNGYDISNGNRGDDEETDIVYMAENGQVYHEDRSCTHLRLNIMQVSRSEAQSRTNQYGKRYSACEKCNPDISDETLYIAAEGDRFHSDRECSGLKRTVFSVLRSRVAGYRACSRCG